MLSRENQESVMVERQVCSLGACKASNTAERLIAKTNPISATTRKPHSLFAAGRRVKGDCILILAFPSIFFHSCFLKKLIGPFAVGLKRFNRNLQHYNVDFSFIR